LDEIGDLPLELQAHLLRFLQESTIDRVGGVHPIKVDVRVIAATNVPLRKAVAEGRFREDLYFRLNVLTLEMPPLRDRPEDLDPLVAFFIAKFCRETGKAVTGPTADAMLAMRRHPWPGNIRELIATIRRAIVMADGPMITRDDLALPSNDADDLEAGSLDSARREAEETLIRRALASHRHNITRTAEHLGVSRVTLYRLLEKHGIPARAP
ncbi:MAG TPA: sigma 54-interacting transcriptional regulator, partial [Magnetospirillum sp.]|nr:sigma 54-interacting transcriptional regulator [Magnetospirillum sp.]